MWRLTIIDDDGQQTLVPLDGPVDEIGRARGNRIRLTDRNVSRWHARIERAGDELFLEDRESWNGTFLNGQRVHGRRPLVHGDVVHIGDTRLRIESQAAERGRAAGALRGDA